MKYRGYWVLICHINEKSKMYIISKQFLNLTRTIRTNQANGYWK